MRDHLAEQIDRFAIADGGPFVELQRRLGLPEAKAAAAPRRAAIFVAVAFGVPLVLAIAAGDAWGPAAEWPFLLDWGIWLVLILALFGLPLFASSAAATRHFRASERATSGGNLAAATDADDTAVGDIPNPTAIYAAAKKLRTLPFSREALLPVAAAAPVPLVLAGATRLPFAELWKIARKLLLL